MNTAIPSPGEWSGSHTVGDWTISYRGVRVADKPADCPWPYMIRRLNGVLWMVLQLHERIVTHRPSGDWLELTWSPDAPQARPWQWHAVSGDRDATRMLAAFRLLQSTRRGRPPGLTDIAEPEDVATAYLKLQVQLAGARAPRQNEVATRLGVSLRTLQRYRREHGIRWPPI